MRPRLRLPKRRPSLPRLRFPTRGPGSRSRLPYGMTPETVLRGLAKLVAVVVVAGLGGLAIGTALAELSGDGDDSTGATGGPPETSAPTTTAAADGRGSTQRQSSATDVRVRVLSAVLKPADTPGGRQRQRARLSVRVRVTNRGSGRVVPSRPVLVSGGDRVETDPNADTTATNLEALAPGETGDVTLRFETAGAVTKRVAQQRRARLIVAGRRVTAAVIPDGNGAAARGDASSGTATQQAPPP